MNRDLVCSKTYFTLGVVFPSLLVVYSLRCGVISWEGGCEFVNRTQSFRNVHEYFLKEKVKVQSVISEWLQLSLTFGYESSLITRSTFFFLSFALISIPVCLWCIPVWKHKCTPRFWFKSAFDKTDRQKETFILLRRVQTFFLVHPTSSSAVEGVIQASCESGSRSVGSAARLTWMDYMLAHLSTLGCTYVFIWKAALDETNNQPQSF